MVQLINFQGFTMLYLKRSTDGELFPWDILPEVVAMWSWKDYFRCYCAVSAVARHRVEVALR